MRPKDLGLDKKQTFLDLQTMRIVVAHKQKIAFPWQLDTIAYCFHLLYHSLAPPWITRILFQNCSVFLSHCDTQLEFEVGNNKEYKVEGIWDSAVYARELARQLLGLYYLVLWKGYSEEENTWEFVSAIQHLQRLTNTYHKNNPEIPTATSLFVNTVLPMVRLTVAPTKKCGRPAKSTTTTKWAKKS